MKTGVTLRHRLGDFTLDAAFEFGESPCVTALFGPSGAGKSTVLAAIAGLFRPQSGRIALGGEVLFDSERGIFVPARERRVGIVFQDARLFPHMSVHANLLYGWRRARGPARRETIDPGDSLLGLGGALAPQPATR